MSRTQIAVCTTTFDKYKPGKQKFFLQALVPMGAKNNEFSSSSADTSNILNKDVGALNIKPCQTGSIIELEVPKDICRWFDVKFIPEGTGET